MSLPAPSGFVVSAPDVEVVAVGAVVEVVDVVGAVVEVVVGAVEVVEVVLDVTGAVVVGAVTVLVDPSSSPPHPDTAIPAAARAEAQRTRSGARAGIRSRRLWLPGAGRSAGSR